MSASIVDQIIALGTEFNANQYKLVQLAADYDIGLEWFNQGFESPATAIARALDIHSSTAREWIRIGHAINYLPLIDEAFRTNTLSYAKVRIVTRRADEENEHELLEIAHERSANRLTTAINKHLSGDETEDERDQRHDDIGSVTTFTDADGMIIIRAALPPSAGKQVVEALNTIMAQVAATPCD